MIALVIGIHSCLTQSKIFSFYIVSDTFKAFTKSLKTCQVGNFRSGPLLGSGWENQDRWRARAQLIWVKEDSGPL